ncbi:hypothetical protein PIIN_05404 [Serendipita indica DSM 11827]|uniref:Cytochrome P450 n=1 Tax=Serendipita indica (strain DSM 11827) TaxID=1109443 RepID=G4TJH3_SERID|nr:hypothetical protein PIIN_05404 [Serendipita indica DSM 11827]
MTTFFKPLSATHAWALGAIAVSFVAIRIASNTNAAKAKRSGASLAPGPKRWPFVGSVLKFPKSRWYESFSSWAEEYGDVVYVDLMGIPMIVLNSLDAIHELTEKRMHIHSNRPHTTLVCDIMGFGYTLTLKQPDKELNEQRRILQKAIGPRVVGEYDHFLNRGCSDLLQRLDGFSGEPFDHVLKVLGELLTRLAYGNHVFDEYGAELVKANIEGVELVSWVFSRLWVVDIIPLLRYVPAWFPGATFQRIGIQARAYVQIIRHGGFEKVKAAMAKGIADESILSKYLMEESASEDNLRDAVAVMYATGVDSTATTITNFLYAVALYPEWQRKIHDEMDRELGRGHVPTAEDIGKLNIFNAVMKETLRWLATVPLGVPHVSAKEDIFNGYYIPKGTMLHCNIGYVLRDKRIWGPDSLEFNPNRFLSKFNPTFDDLPDIWSVPFGFGRRICPGRYIAQRIVLQYASAILATYEVLPCEGEQLTPNEPFDDAAIRYTSIAFSMLV